MRFNQDLRVDELKSSQFLREFFNKISKNIYELSLLILKNILYLYLMVVYESPCIPDKIGWLQSVAPKKSAQ